MDKNHLKVSLILAWAMAIFAFISGSIFLSIQNLASADFAIHCSFIPLSVSCSNANGILFSFDILIAAIAVGAGLVNIVVSQKHLKQSEMKRAEKKKWFYILSILGIIGTAAYYLTHDHD